MDSPGTAQKTAQVPMEEAQRPAKEPAADANQLRIRIDKASVLALRQEEEEDGDADADFDDDEIESELGDADDTVPPIFDAAAHKGVATPPPRGSPLSPMPRTPKRTLGSHLHRLRSNLPFLSCLPSHISPKPSPH